MGSRAGFTLRAQALEELKKSTKSLEVACELLKQGNHAEAKRLQSEARAQRTISTLLMNEANRQEADANILKYRGYPETAASFRHLRG